MILTLYICLQITVQPFKESSLSEANAIFMLLLALWHVSILGMEVSTRSMSKTLLYLFSSVAFLIFLGFLSFLILRWLYSHERIISFAEGMDMNRWMHTNIYLTAQTEHFF